MTRHAITIRVDYDTLTELHKLTANAKTTAFADVAGELLDKAAAPNTYLVSLAPDLVERYKLAAWNNHMPIEQLFAMAIAHYGKPIATNSAQQFSEEAINLEQR